jgi:hypothetical protein
MDFVKHLETLGLEPGASPEEVRRAFRERMAAWNPDRLPDSPSFQRDGVHARAELEAAYRFLMTRYGLDASDIDEQASQVLTQAAVSAPPRTASATSPPRPVAPPTERIPIVRMIVVTGVVLLSLVFLVPAVRDGRLASWAESVLEVSVARLASWFPTPGAPPPPPEATGNPAVRSLPRLTKAQVLQRYGEPRAREAGRWTYSGFSILFQDDSIASLLVRDTTGRN